MSAPGPRSTCQHLAAIDRVVTVAAIDRVAIEVAVSVFAKTLPVRLTLPEPTAMPFSTPRPGVRNRRLHRVDATAAGFLVADIVDCQCVRSGPTGKTVNSRRTVDEVIAVATVDRVVAGVARQGVVVVRTDEILNVGTQCVGHIEVASAKVTVSDPRPRSR